MLKIFGNGFYKNKNAYIRNRWNVLDFVVVNFAWIKKLKLSPFDLTAMRSLRIMKPLKMISKNKNLKVIFFAILNSAP